MQLKKVLSLSLVCPRESYMEEYKKGFGRFRRLAQLGLIDINKPETFTLNEAPTMFVEDPGENLPIKVYVIAVGRSSTNLVYEGPAQRSWFQNSVTVYEYQQNHWDHTLHMTK